MNSFLEHGLIEKSICTREEKVKLIPLLKHIVTLSDRARRNGLLDLEEIIPEIKESLYRLGLWLVLDGTDPEEIYRILNNNILSSGAVGVRLLAKLQIVTGVMLIQAGQNPRYIEVELASLTGDDYQAIIESLRN